MSSDKEQIRYETQRDIEKYFSFWSFQRKMLNAEGRLSSFAANFFGYRWLTLSKDFEYTYTKKVNVTYAVETTYTTEANVNSLGNIELETSAQDKTYEMPVDEKHEGESVAKVYKKIKFVSDFYDTVKKYEEELASDKKFKSFVNSQNKRKRPNFILYLLNYIFDISTATLMLFALLQMIILPFIISGAKALFKFEINISYYYTSDNMGFYGPLPVVVLVIFIACLVLNQLIKIKLGDDFLSFAVVIITGVLYVLLGYFDYFVQTNETLNNLYENVTWFNVVVSILAFLIMIFLAVASAKYIFFSIFKTRYFVALHRYIGYKKGQKMASAGMFDEMQRKYDLIMMFSDVSFDEIDFSTLENRGIDVSY